MPEPITGQIQVELVTVDGGARVSGDGGATTRRQPKTSPLAWGNLFKPGGMGNIAKTFGQELGIMKFAKVAGWIGLIVGALMFIKSIIQRSKIFSTFYNAFMEILSAVVDLLLVPVLPLLLKVLKWFVNIFMPEKGETAWGHFGKLVADAWLKIFTGEGLDFWAMVKENIALFFAGEKPDFWKLVLSAILVFLTGKDLNFWIMVGTAIGRFFSGPFVDFWIMVGTAITKFFSGPFVDFWVVVGTAIGKFFSGPFVDFWVEVAKFTGKFFSGSFVDFWLLIANAVAKFFSGPFVDFWTMIGSEIKKFFTGTIPDFWAMVTSAIKSMFGGGGGGGDEKPVLQLGTPYVPRNMLAYLHQGERVIPASQNYIFNQSFAYQSPTAYLAGRDMMSGFAQDLKNTLLRQGI